MQSNEFMQFKDDFITSDVNGKINMYVSADSLTKEQYKELLQHFPMDQLKRLEDALG